MKIFKLLLKIFLVLFILLGIAVGVVIYQLSDNSFHEPSYLSTLETNTLNFDDMLSKSLKDTKDTSKLSFTLEEKEINGVLKATKDNLNNSLNGTGVSLKTMYVEFEAGHDINFVSYIDFSGFMTSLSGDFYMDLENDKFLIKVENLKIGKMNFDKATVSSIIQNAIGGDSLGNDLEVAGLKIDTDLNNMVISVDINELEKELTNSISGDNSFYSTMINMIFRTENILSLSEKDHMIGFDFNVSPFAYNETIDVASPFDYDFNAINDKVEILLNNGSIQKENASDVASFLAKGINSSSNAISSVSNVDLSSVGINDKESYEGIVNFEDVSLEDVFTSQVPESSEELATFEGFKLDESDWNNILVESDVIGEVYTFVRKENNVYKSSYIAVEGLYMDIINDHFAIYVLMSLNGKTLVINFEFDSNESNGLTLDASLESMRFGQTELLDEEIESILSFMSESIKEDWFVINSESKTMSFNFANVFAESEILTNFANIYGSNLSTSFVGDENIGYSLIGLA